ncbi:MAG TPA: hypothetical protein VLF93_04835 [Candidatus Saccharimonadales bacterium]|nr:hypothetical protein [Candidatus Saccharimonadales bacterium]
MPETFVSSSQMLHDAVAEYQYITPDGGSVWCPYIVNGGRRLPNPSTDFLNRPGAGKVRAVEFQKAAQYAYEQVMLEGVGYLPSIAEAIRLRLVNGSLPDDNYNYTGVDCSALVTSVVQPLVAQSGKDLFDQLIIPNDGATPGYTGGLSANEFTRKFRGHNQPLRAVNVSRLAANSVSVRGDLQPGDLAVYTPTNPQSLRHVSVVLDADGGDHVTLAHSGRRDPAAIGGVEIFTLPRKKVFDRERIHGQRGTMEIRRLNALAS